MQKYFKKYGLFILLGLLIIPMYFLFDATTLHIIGLYAFLLSMGGLLFFAIHVVTNSNWAKELYKQALYQSKFIFWGAAILIIGFYIKNNSFFYEGKLDLNNNTLYNSLLAIKVNYFSKTNILIRFLSFIVIIYWFIYKFQTLLKSDNYKRLKKISGIFILFTLVFFTIFGYDFLINSMQKNNSSIIGWLAISGSLLSGIVFLFISNFFTSKINPKTLIKQKFYVFIFYSIWLYFFISWIYIQWYSGMFFELQFINNQSITIFSYFNAAIGLILFCSLFIQIKKYTFLVINILIFILQYLFFHNLIEVLY